MLSKRLTENKCLNAHLADKFDEYEKLILGSTLVETFEEKYQILKYLGGGAFGKAYEVVNRKTNEKSVAKFIPHNGDDFPDEVVWLQKLKHKYIVEYLEHFVTENHVILITRKHGEHVMTLMEYAKALGGRIPENTMKYIMLQLMLAVEHLHNNGCAHFDIKADNVIINERLQIKLIDFGLVDKIKTPGEEQFCGPYGCLININPEMQSYHEYSGPEADIWSLGVTAFCLVSGSFPFKIDENTNLVFPKEKSFPVGKARFSEDLRQFLSAALTKDSRHRPNIKELYAQPLAQSYCVVWCSCLQTFSLLLNF